MALACRQLLTRGRISQNPITTELAAVSVGIVGESPLLDLKYDEDSAAEVDMNLVCTGDGRFIEVQGTAEGAPFSRAELDQLLALGGAGIEKLIQLQRLALAQPSASA
jgi:ribonuclease PH